MSAKKSPAAPKPAHTDRSVSPAPEWLLVCLADPYEAVGDSSKIARVTVPMADGGSFHLWELEVVLEMHPPRTFQGWATRRGFTLDLSVQATVLPATSGTWGGTVDTLSGIGNCRVTVARDADQRIRFSRAAGCHHATERAMPAPEERRFLNADIAFESHAAGSVTAGAAAAISNKNWFFLTAGTNAPDAGMAFDDKWRRHLDPADGSALVSGSWEFAVLTKDEYEAWCEAHARVPYILD